MNVVRYLSSSCSGTLWYPFQASNTVFFVWWGTDLAWRKGDCVVSFTGSMFVQWLEVNSATWLSSLFRADHHPVAPCDRLSNGYRLTDTTTDVLILLCVFFAGCSAENVMVIVAILCRLWSPKVNAYSDCLEHKWLSQSLFKLDNAQGNLKSDLKDDTWSVNYN